MKDHYHISELPLYLQKDLYDTNEHRAQDKENRRISKNGYSKSCQKLDAEIRAFLKQYKESQEEMKPFEPTSV